MIRHVIALAALAPLGCSSAPEPAAAPRPAADLLAPAPAARAPMPVKWSDYNFHVDGEKLWGSISPRGTAYSVHLYDGPSDLKYQAGSLHGSASSDGSAAFEIDLRESLGGALVDDLKRFAPDVTLVLETPTKRAEARLPPMAFTSLPATIAGELAHGPFLFGAEPKDANEHDCLLEIAGDHAATRPRACKLREVDEVAVVHLGDVRGKKACTGYGEMGVRPGHKTLTMSLHETRVDVYERRTGKRLDGSVFPPEAVCPKAATVTAGQTEIDNALNWPPAEAWIKARAAKLQ
jgi:hypothetical protein